MAATAPTWNEIAEACTAAGLDIDLWEEDLHDRLITYILTHTKSVEKYHYDPIFHAEMERLIGLVIGCLMEHSPLVEPAMRARAAEFDAMFRRGVQEGRPLA
jgi:hypothetical protein